MCFKRKLAIHPDATPVTAATDFSFCNYSQKEAKMDIELMQYKEIVTHKQEINIRILTY